MIKNERAGRMAGSCCHTDTDLIQLEEKERFG